MAILALFFVLSFTGAFGVETVDVNEAYENLQDEHDKLKDERDEFVMAYIKLHEDMRDCKTSNTWEDTTCPTDFIGFRGKCYWFNMNRLGWNESQVACIRKGGNLASIRSYPEQAFLAYQAATNYGTNDTIYDDYYWLGMEVMSDRLVWWDGAEVEYRNFDEGKPNCMRNVVLYCKVAMASTVDYRWQDRYPGLETFSICQKL